jgi:hypothetical protein
MSGQNGWRCEAEGGADDRSCNCENGLCLYKISGEFEQIFNRCVEKAPRTRSNLCIEAPLTNHGLDDPAYPQEVVHVRRLLDVAVRT